MPQACSICTHSKRDKINACLTANTQPLRNIAQRYGVSRDALQRHKSHIPAHLVRAQEVNEAAAADTLLDQVQHLQTKALGVLSIAEANGDLKTMLGSIKEARGCIELLAKLTGELAAQPTVNVTLSVQWLEVRAVLLAALEPHSDAKRAVLEALGRVNA